MSLIGKLKKHELIHPPKFLENNMLYLTTMGSQAYGVSTDNSDLDLYGFCMPPLETLFPNSYGGEIEGFTKKANRFEQWSQHSIKSPDSDTVYDFTVYNIAKYFRLTADANPNMVDSIFTPQHCVTFNTEIGQMVRDNRKMFLSKKVMHTFRGYAYQQQHKMKSKENSANPRRQADIDAVSYDCKYAYHLVRLLYGAEQILVTGDYDIQRDREVLKSIRRREWTMEQLDTFFESKLKHIEDAYAASTIPHGPDEDAIGKLLLNCIEHHYGSISRVLATKSVLADEIQAVLDRHKN